MYIPLYNSILFCFNIVSLTYTIQSLNKPMIKACFADDHGIC